MNETRPGYYAIIPADVRFDKALSPNAKMLYCEISAHIGNEGYCNVSKQYFASILGINVTNVSRLLNKLQDSGYIARKIVNGKEVIVCGRVSH